MVVDVIIDFELLFERDKKKKKIFKKNRLFSSHTHTHTVAQTRRVVRDCVGRALLINAALSSILYTHTHAASRNMRTDNGRVNMGSLCLHEDEN